MHELPKMQEPLARSHTVHGGQEADSAVMDKEK